eukprot:gb/GECG01009566.1/.p1 GENE.gb/GECG01009566.1/~~gb/GECG01009566.1/.p1  ORF type:complete len:627 (+),score=86.53 gb/GECG01009566.1/:1-1881(+)
MPRKTKTMNRDSRHFPHSHDIPSSLPMPEFPGYSSHIPQQSSSSSPSNSSYLLGSQESPQGGSSPYFPTGPPIGAHGVPQDAQLHPKLGSLTLMEQQQQRGRHPGMWDQQHPWTMPPEQGDSSQMLTGGEAFSMASQPQLPGQRQQQPSTASTSAKGRQASSLANRNGRKLQIGPLDIPDTHESVENTAGKRVRTPSFQKYIHSPYGERYKPASGTGFLPVPSAESPAARAAKSSQFWETDAPKEEDDEGDASGSEDGRTNSGSQRTEGDKPLGIRRAPAKKWSPEEDECLKQAVARRGGKNWKKIAEDVPGRNHVQCLQRYRKVLAPGLKKGHWSDEEDEHLRQIVAEGVRNWGDVAAKIPGRTAKQCRERWTNHLHPSIKKGDWTEEEDRKLLEAYEELGQRWSKIAASLPGRTENAVKIRWKGLQRKQRRSSGGRRSSVGSVSSGFTDDSNPGAQQHRENQFSSGSPLQTIASEGNIVPDAPVGGSFSSSFYEPVTEPSRGKSDPAGGVENTSLGFDSQPNWSWYSSVQPQQQPWGSGRNLAQPHGSGQSLRSLFSFSSVSSSRSRMSNNSMNQDMFPPSGSWGTDNPADVPGSNTRTRDHTDLDFHDVVDVSLKTDYVDDHE